jgi:hypothetical protein
MERAANESVSNVDNSEEGETTSSSSAELEHQQTASTQTHSVVCWNIQCPDCPAPIARITPWSRSAPPPPPPRQLTPEDRRAAFALASLRGADPVRSEEITRATGSGGSLVALAVEAQRQGRPIGEQEIHRSSAGERLAAGTPPTPAQRRFSSFIAPRSSTPRPPPSANRTVSPPPPFSYQPPASPTPSITADPFEDRPVHRPLSLSDARLRTRNLLLRSASTAASILADVVLRSAFPQWERWFVGVRTERNAIVRAVNLYQRAKVEAKIFCFYSFYTAAEFDEIFCLIRQAEDHLITLGLHLRVCSRRPYGQWEPEDSEIAIRGVYLWGPAAIFDYRRRRANGEFPADRRN